MGDKQERLLKSVQDDLIVTHPDLIVRGLMDKGARSKLREVVRKNHRHIVGTDEDLIEYIVRETVGTGIIEDIIQDDNVTDIGYNGTELFVEGNDFKEVYMGSQRISEEYIVRIVQKFANAVGKEFTPKDPVLDAVFGTIRLNAVHQSRSGMIPGTTTMSMRIVRPRLVLNKENFDMFAPMDMYEFFEKVVGMRANITIAGETGTGKTELQKLFMSFVEPHDKMVIIEDVPETHAKELFPDKDIYSWITSEGTTITELVKAGLRNNPRWIMVTETRGEEAYELIQAVLSGHHIITSLHAISADAIPRRMVNMAKMGYDVSEGDLEDDIRRYFDLGLQLGRRNYKGKVIRYLKEVIEFGVDKNRVLFRQEFRDGEFISKTGELSSRLKGELELNYPEYKFKEGHMKKRKLGGLGEDGE